MSKMALISGGSSGIGYSLSRYFAKAGYTLLWVSLLPEEIEVSKKKLLQEIEGCTIHTLVEDLSITNAAHKVHQWVTKNEWSIDVLVNNAGFGTYGYLSNTPLEKELKMVHLHVVCVYEMTKLFLKDMTNKNKGTIINISSNSSFQPTPKLSTYGATKAFVTHFSRSLNEELKMQQSKVKVICVCPAAIENTNFKKSGNMEKVRTFQGIAATTVEEVASDIWKGFSGGKDFIISGRKMRMLYRISGLLPYRFQQFLVRKEIKEIA
ncbi:SDR family NAD(P)-dependent oxidoreductase [Aquimarina spongiae]|uniref:Short-chain dehydrogenase n=1 Tax=Aquimarina spongiae TaxID=570521 RepID=A0A1M6JRK9_9FLAO|nr:SDR family NAD(P)-dependent oxidoreductase [Aquimarina spongiae]SHJ49291.1 hypothetical protein SAMN04488508_109208 [Aquimarina spongiae]